MTDDAQRFKDATGSPWMLTAEDPTRVDAYLRERNFLGPAESVTALSRAGEGNMNVTLRVKTIERQFILKQSRPWVAKYPTLPAPVDRILVEKAYLERTSCVPALAAHTPALLAADPENFVLLLEDLTGAEDLLRAYDHRQPILAEELRAMLAYLSELHQMAPGDFPANLPLRELNHAHIFVLPFRADNGFPLDDFLPGLAEVARPYQHDADLAARAAALGERYLATGSCLVHGDFYPGSLMSRGGHLFVIDGEFAHPGHPEFDLGVLTAHLLLAAAPAEQLQSIDQHYRKPAGFDTGLARQFCYVEVLRRLIGIAQLPLALTLGQRKALLAQAHQGLLD
ncbi:phosphotransferase [Neolewinella lacunae]|uniref:Phosphotransferase n=1 Tax=Neolewinella lacunae TaxID=1517758 RepID=A0A923T7Y8_9BACT|nr:phosphotransferase [Neolewinella lacunae]MBC6995035.1 phosphotransferase [Neolewinella lacunae]MDN3633194.1 phosphotransferase [Neolewinella lacunae]